MNAFSPVDSLALRRANFDDPDERRRIDSFAQGHRDAQPFHLTHWGRAVEDGCGQRGFYLLAERGDGRIAGILPLTEVRSRLFGSALVSVGFGVGGGILADDERTVGLLAEAAWSSARASGIASVELRGGPVPEDWRAARGVYAGFAKDLPSDPAAVLASIPRKQRAEVRRALGNDLQVSTGRGERDRADHYRTYSESVRNLGTPVFPRSLFDSVLDRFGDAADLVVVRKNGVPLAAVLSLYFNGTVFPYWGGGSAAARSARANELLYYALMRHAIERGCTRFDFGRSKLGTGAFAFKKNWGFDPEPLTYARRGRERDVNPLSPKYRLQVALWKRLPIPVAGRLGPVLARGLG